MTAHIALLFFSLTFILPAAAIPLSRDNGIHLVIAQGPPISELKATDLSSSHKALSILQTHLGPDGIASLIQDDLDAADTFWHETTTNSSGAFVGSDTRVKGLVSPDILNSTSWLEWFSTAGVGFPNRMTAAEPEHYLEMTITDGSTSYSNLIEGWGGGPITHFQAPLVPKQVFMPRLPEFPTQFSAALTLLDGTVFGYSLTAVRDLPNGSGLEVFEGMWFPDSTPEYITEGAKAHLAIEVSNWLLFAYSDTISG
jgi:hypothetical protein